MKKGFTLIELLAVIVILAVITLIAVPIILSLVDKSRTKAAEESMLFYVDTIENMLMINNVENTDGKTYKIKGRTVVDEKGTVVLNLEIKGDVPDSGVANEITINNGFIERANLRFNSYYVHYEMDRTTKKFKTCTSQKGFLDTCAGTGEVKPSEPDEPLKKYIAEEVEIGDYINYTPHKTSYSLSSSALLCSNYGSTQSINPSRLSLWRVIRRNENGTVDIVSEYLPNDNLHYNCDLFSSSTVVYQRYITDVNRIAVGYETEGYTVGSRAMGYDSTKEDNVEDTYKTDATLVKEAIGTLKARMQKESPDYAYRLASRFIEEGVRKIHVVNNEGIVEGVGIGSTTLIIRPIVILSSTLTIQSGDGSIDQPYELKI